MPAGGICPQCRNDVSPMARFCANCGLELAARKARAVWNVATFFGFFAGIALLIGTVGAICFLGVQRTQKSIEQSQAEAHSYSMEGATEDQRQAFEHAHDPWWDPAEPDGLKKTFFGKEYTIGPGGWTSIDVTSPAQSGQFRYVVELEGLDHFRARPNGEAEREYVYPNRENLQPYQMSGWCRTLLVQPLDSAVHRVRVKYVRTAIDRRGTGY